MKIRGKCKFVDVIFHTRQCFRRASSRASAGGVVIQKILTKTGSRRPLRGLAMANLGLVLFLPQFLSAHPSLFFTESETQSETNNLHLHLKAMMYVDPNHWTLWINDHVIHASDSRQMGDVLIEHVTPQTVQFSWQPPHAASTRRFTLRVNEKVVLQ